MSTALRNLALVHLNRHPDRAARILENYPPTAAAKVLLQAPPASSAAVLARLEPRFASTCLQSFPAETRRLALSELPVPAAAAVLRLLPQAARGDWVAGLPDSKRQVIHRAVRRAPHSAGALANDEADFKLESFARPLQHVPETLAISRLLREMQRTHRHMALVDDEYGAVAGMVTMENLVEQIVGAVQDEFDSEAPDVLSEGRWTYKVKGQLPLARVNRECGLDLYSADVETLSGLLASRLGRLLKQGDRVQLRGATAEVVEERNGRADVVRIHIARDQDAEE